MRALRLWAALYIDTNIVQDRDALRDSIYDVLGNAPLMDDDDVGPDVYVDIRDLTNASIRIGAHEVYVQTRAYIFAVGDIYGLTEEELKTWLNPLKWNPCKDSMNDDIILRTLTSRGPVSLEPRIFCS